MKFQDLAKKLQNNQISPSELSVHHGWLSAEYAFISSKMAKIQMKKPLEWSIMRAQKSSDKQADLEWDTTPEGQDEIKYRYYLKALEKMMSSIKTRINILDGESRNRY